MKIELIKKTSLDGVLTAAIVVDGVILKEYKDSNMNDALKYGEDVYNEVVKRAKEGYPKQEVIKSIEI